MLAHQHDAGGPAFARSMDRIAHRLRQSRVGGDRRGLVGSEAELFPIDFRDRLIGGEARELRRRRHPRDEDNVEARRQLANPFAERESPDGIRGRFMEIVDDEHGAGRKERKESAHEPPRERRQIGQVFGAESGQFGNTLGPRAGKIGCGESQVVKQRSRIGVTGVGLEPDPLQLARNDIAADERRFARARGTRDPNERMSAQRVDAREQSLALQDVVEPRTTELGKRHRRRIRPRL